NKHCLLLLDNFEHLLAAATVVTDLLAAAPLLKILVTSREVLHLYGEREVQVLPLDLPMSSAQDFPTDSAAMTLFVERARAVRPAFTLNPDNWHAVAEICIRLDGLPLAIELAAARCKLLTPQAILTRLGRRLDLLTGGARDLPYRQQTLRNTLDWSYDLLDEEEQLCFCRLGVFVGSWTLEAAEALLGKSSSDPLLLLTSLVDKSLVSLAEPEADEIRFLLLETMREYALERLDARVESEETHDCHASFYVGLAEEVAHSLHNVHQQTGLQSLDREAANLWEALRWSIDFKKMDVALRLASALYEYLPLRQSLKEERDWFNEILALDGVQGASAPRARVFYGAGTLERMRGDLVLARAHLEESRTMALQVGDPQTHALALGMLAQLELYAGAYPQALNLVEQGLSALNDDLEHKWCRGLLHRIYGNIASRQGNFAIAQTRYALSLMLLREAGDLRNQAETLMHLGNLARQRGKLRTSHYLYERSLRLFRELGDRWGQLICLNCLGDTLRLQAEYKRASSCFEESVALLELLGDRAERIVTLIGQGQIALSLNLHDQANQYLKEALHLSRELDYTSGLVQTLCGLGDLERIQGNWSSAILYYTQALEVAKNTDDKLTRIYLLFGLGDAARELGKLALACSQIKQGLYLAWEIGNSIALPSGMEALAWLCIQSGQPESAAHLLGAAHELRETLQIPLAPVYQTPYASRLTALKASIGQEAFDKYQAEGRSLLLQQVMNSSVAGVHISEIQEELAQTSPTLPYKLTRRELDVLRLLAQGYADARIANLLFISPRTVNTHLRSIYAKLGVSSRSAATRIALERGLA
ncbi:MAG TPA: tetratricopeptide repeat protein, partial [Ktedonobacteraceae bacterium]|nr:tetratricopeptide repeat protein [Ktedonobacteraceae bacterium]